MSATIEVTDERPIDREPTVSREDIAAKYQKMMEERGDYAPAAAPEPTGEILGDPEDYANEPKDEPIAIAEPEPVREVAPDPAPTAQPAYQPQFQQQQVVQPQLFPVQLPDGRVTYVTGDQLQQFASVGIASAYGRQEQRAPEPEPKRADPLDPDRVREIARKIQYGSEDDSANALLEFARTVAPPVDVEAIKHQAVQEALGQYQSQRDLDTVASEFPLVAREPRLGQMAALALHEIRNDPRSSMFPPVELYREACRRTMSWVNQFAQPMGQPQPEVTQAQPTTQAAAPVSAQKLERKRAVPSTVSGATRRSGASEEQEAETTPSDVVAAMRKARGQSPI